MKTVKRFLVGEAIPAEGVFIRIEVVYEQCSTEELYAMHWPGLGPVPCKKVEYVWYELPVPLGINHDPR